MSAVPTLKEEIDRKSADTMSWLAHSLDKGRITEDQFSVAVDAVNRAVCGLAGEWFVELVTASQDLCPTHKSSVTKFFLYGASKLARLKWIVSEDVVHLGIFRDGALISDSPKEFDDAKQAVAFLRNAGDAFIKNGWKAL